jgi:hypothetical protein
MPPFETKSISMTLFFTIFVGERIPQYANKCKTKEKGCQRSLKSWRMDRQPMITKREWSPHGVFLIKNQPISYRLEPCTPNAYDMCIFASARKITPWPEALRGGHRPVSGWTALQKAVLATAHKLIRVMFAMLRNKTLFDARMN